MGLFDQLKSLTSLSGLVDRIFWRSLTKYLEAQGKSLVTGISDGTFLNALAPQGIDELPGPTIISVLAMPAEGSVPSGLTGRIPPLIDKHQAASLLAIASRQLGPEEKEHLRDAVSSAANGIAIEIWDLGKMQEIQRQYAQYVSPSTPELARAAIDNILEKGVTATAEAWKTTRDKYVQQLKREYQENDIVLILGAGVSRSTDKVPDWNGLLSKLLVALIDRKLPDKLSVTPDEKQLLAKALHDVHSSFPLVEASYIRAGLADDFDRLVSEALYEGVGQGDVVESPLLKALAQLCVPRRSGPKVRAVVTFNFDDLFERHPASLGLESRSIYRDLDIASQDELPIYHVHGFLPQTIDQYEGLSDSLLVFSEEGYHALMRDPFSWSNIIQLNLLREVTCVMVGLSLTDPNLRRLLDIAARKGNSPRHYAFLRRELASLTDPGAKNGRRLQPLVGRAVSNVHHEIQESSFQQLGVNVIWVRKHEEIPPLLDSLRAR